MHFKGDIMIIKEEVRQALVEKRPVVALESTIISHGLPYPDNIEVAKRLEDIIREEGAVPATIAIINGVPHIGLEDEHLELLAKADVEKVSRRDIPYVMAKKLHGATTVSATMIFAEKANIFVFATGGIGGVHRDASDTMDISRDLEELASVRCCVVAAGIKSILDLPKTLEYLETKGVEVIGYQTKVLPAFYAATSPYPLDIQLDTPEDIASVMKHKWSLGLSGGMLVANPIPKDAEIPFDVIEASILEALEEAKKEGIQGKRTTPYLLSKVKDLTKGQSLEANKALVYHNARLAAKIAKAYAEIPLSN
jgi:pseudouridylate synthase